ncbi:MAG TPA: ThiF family adenylyltransferase [Anaerolineales bacterium]|nr:ThiF family adenylyltransferase [Anaerolineales bacterium]
MFERNYGVFTAEEQARIRAAKVVIVGTGGIGGTVATILARSGVEHFVLYEHDIYTITNMNRQIGCFTDTLGISKAEVITDSLLRINPEAQIQMESRSIVEAEMDEVILQGDVFLPAADDWPLSMNMLGRAKELGKPAILAYPVGALGRVSIFMPSSPYASECLVIPRGLPYAELEAFMRDPDNRRTLLYYCTEGGWTDEWFEGFCEGSKPHAQLCTIVWITASLAAQEIIKLVSGRFDTVIAPRYWHVTPEKTYIARFSAARRLMARSSVKPWARALLPKIARRPWLLRLFTRALH